MDNDEIKKLLRDLKKESVKEEEKNNRERQRQEKRTAKRTEKKKVSARKKLSLQTEGFFDDLKSRGIAGRELLMIAAVILLLIFIVLAVFSTIFSEDKSRNVTADEGLIVTVEEEPEEWCSGGTVVLGIRTAEPIQAITVNGEAQEFEGERRTKVTLEADREELEVMVVSEQSVMNARVELPMVDSENPMISVQQQGGQIELSAVDSRSGLQGIYIGKTDGLSEIPQYEEYTGPFTPEQNTTYYYYAKDIAGNRTVPVETNLVPAAELILSESRISLFPGKSFPLSISASPAGAYYNNLQITNTDPSVISLAADGTVTALREGSSRIEVSADGLPSVYCEVNVQSEVEITVSAIGDCTLGTDIYLNPSNSFDTVQSMYGDTWFFQNVKSIFENDDLTFANFEGTLTTLDTRSDKQYAFKGDPAYTNILKDGSIEAVTLANNHSSDYGAQSKEDTKRYLREAGIDYCDGEEIIIREVNGVKVGLIGIYVLDTGLEKAPQVESTIAAAQEAGASIIITAFHWGTEKSTQPDETQQTLAHLAIDRGADLVVGHHPHVLQGIEQYQGKYIIYSLGNFCFGGNSAPSDMDTMIFQQTFAVDGDGLVQDSGIHIIPCSISSELYWNNYQPTPATGTEAERIMAKINERSAQFGQSY